MKKGENLYSWGWISNVKHKFLAILNIMKYVCSISNICNVLLFKCSREWAGEKISYFISNIVQDPIEERLWLLPPFIFPLILRMALYNVEYFMSCYKNYYSLFMSPWLRTKSFICVIFASVAICDTLQFVLLSFLTGLMFRNVVAYFLRARFLIFPTINGRTLERNYKKCSYQSDSHGFNYVL